MSLHEDMLRMWQDMCDEASRAPKQRTVYLSPVMVALAESAGIDLDEFYLRGSGAKVEVMTALPKADG